MAAAEYKLLREYYGFCIFISANETGNNKLKGHFLWSLLLHLYSY